MKFHGLKGIAFSIFLLNILVLTLAQNGRLYPRRQITRRPTNVNYQFKNPFRSPSIVSHRDNTNSKTTAVSCKRQHELIPDPSNPKLYKLCMRIRGSATWLLYSYSCPRSTIFDTISSQCVTHYDTTTKTPTSTSKTILNYPTVTAVSVSTSTKFVEKSSAEIIKLQHSSTSKNDEMATEFETTAFPVTTSVPDLEDSSSEENSDILTVPPSYFTKTSQPNPLFSQWEPGMVVVATRRPFPNWTTVANDLNLQRNRKTTRMPSRLTFGDSGKLSTWTASPVTNGMVKHNELSNLKQTTQFPFRWRPHLNKSSNVPQKERFPSMRPNSNGLLGQTVQSK